KHSMTNLHPGLPGLPRASQRAHDLLARMTLEEKLAQLVGFWDQDVDGDTDGHDHAGDVAPMQGEMTSAESASFDDAIRHGIGHLTRIYGTQPIDPVERARWLWQQQRRLRVETRLG